MAKCTICKSCKGKRSCLLTSSEICSLCCGQTRNEIQCLSCSFYKQSARKYKQISGYTPQEMQNSLDLSYISNVIESALCGLDQNNDRNMRDPQAIEIIELLLDIYHFNDSEEKVEEKIHRLDCEAVIKIVKKEMNKVEATVLCKVLSAIYFVAQRRTRGNREYLDVIHKYVGFDSGSVGRTRLFG